MAIKHQARLLHMAREVLMGDARAALPQVSGPKPTFYPVANYVGLPRSTPEAEGVESTFLRQFYTDVANIPRGGAHALLVLRGGKVISEGYFAPYRKDVWHVSHSLCKTFTGTAVGLAIQEGLFALDDSVLDYFPGQAGLFPSRQIKAVTVRHLLTMSSGITLNEVNGTVESDWLKGIFTSPLSFEPGSKFVYNSMNSYLLAALVHKTSGQTLVEYLTPRIFTPMGFGPIGWEHALNDVEKGGWGMYLFIEDMAKLGQLYLQKGRWVVDGAMQQLLPEWWATEATRTQITSEDGQEYGYHMWTEEQDNIFMMNGMFGQYVAGFPHNDVVVAMTAGNANISPTSAAYSLIKQYFVKPLPAVSLPPNPSSHHQLTHALRNLTFGKPAKTPLQKRSAIMPAPFYSRWQLPPQISGDAALKRRAFAFCGTTWQFPKSGASFLPLIIQFMNNNFSNGIKALRLEKSLDSLLLYWEEEQVTLCIPVSFGPPTERTVAIGRENFLITANAELRQNDNNRDVLFIRIIFLEHSSTRIIKLTQTEDNKVLLSMDESPQLRGAMEIALAQNNATTKTENETAEKQSSLYKFIENSETLQYHLNQLCTPDVTGTPHKSSIL